MSLSARTALIMKNWLHDAQAATELINQVNSVVVRLIKSGVVSAGSFTGSPRKAAVIFATPFVSAAYSIAIIGVDGRSWTYELKTSSGFTISSNAGAALTGEVSWTAIESGESS